MRTTCMALLLSTLALPLLSSKPNAAEFTSQATITEVNSHREASFRSVEGTGHTRYKNVFVMTTQIGDKVYEVQGPRLDVGKYSIKMKGDKIGFLSTDKKGNPKEIDCDIVGEHQR
jgi:uncharacterized protein (DUF2141 family)